MKKILIDATSLSDQFRYRGVGVYSYELISRLIQNTNFEWHLLCFNDVNKRILDSNVVYHMVGDIFPSSIPNLWKFPKLYKKIINEIKPDLYFSPQFERGIPSPTDEMKVSVMLHDIIPVLHNSYSKKSGLHNYLKGIYYKYQLNKACKSNFILTNSNNSKNDIQKYAHIPDEKIGVTYLGVNDVYRSENISEEDVLAVKEKYSLNREYLLYFGGFDPNKNVEKLARAFVKFNEKNKSKELLLITSDLEFTENNRVRATNELAVEVAKIINDAGIVDKIRIIKYLPDSELAAVLKGAFAFLHFSSAEGFGLSVLEALSAGCPTIIANQSCYPELFGKASILVDPLDNDQIFAELSKLKDEEYRKAIIEDSLKLSKKYSWDKTAKTTLSYFTNILSDASNE